MSATHRADSAPFADHGVEEPTAGVSVVDLASVLGDLSPLNRVQLAFFLYGVSGPLQRRELRAFVVGDETFDVVRDALDALTAAGSETPIVEIMYVMEKFALLRKTVNLCQHAAKRLYGSPKRISEFWRNLGAFCEACQEDEAHDIVKHFLPDVPFARLQPAEAVVLLLYENGILKDGDCSRLYEYITGRYDEELVKTIRPASEERYPMVHSPHGRAIIINHDSFRDPNNVVKLDTRSGTARDVDALRCLWKEFGFEVEVWQDKTGVELNQLLAELGQHDLASFDAFVLVILSHGYKGGFYASDCKRVSLEAVESFLCNRCEALRGKPKVVCVQACQINDSVDEVNCNALGSGSPKPLPSSLQEVMVGGPNVLGTAPNRADMLKFMSTIPNYVSYRDPDAGSVFVREFVSVVRENWRSRDLVEMATIINDRIASKAIPVLIRGQDLLWDRQVSEVTSSLRKKLFLRMR